MPSDLSLFMGQLIRQPEQVVALAPSSRALARKMAQALPRDPGTVIELGPGTGKITRALLDHGVAPADLVCFELNPTFCATLRSRFADIDVREAAAQEMGHIGRDNIGAVVSGLPLLSMPNSVQRAIVGSAFKALRPGGVFIQFTYGPTPPVASSLIRELGLSWRKSSRVWGNLPPARVYTFYRTLN